MLLLDYARDQLGLACRGRHNGRVITWTTSEKKAEEAVSAGANCTTATAHSGRVIGYEISFPVDREVIQKAA